MLSTYYLARNYATNEVVKTADGAIDVAASVANLSKQTGGNSMANAWLTNMLNAAKAYPASVQTDVISNVINGYIGVSSQGNLAAIAKNQVLTGLALWSPNDLKTVSFETLKAPAMQSPLDFQSYINNATASSITDENNFGKAYFTTMANQNNLQKTFQAAAMKGGLTPALANEITQAMVSNQNALGALVKDNYQAAFVHANAAAVGNTALAAAVPAPTKLASWDAANKATDEKLAVVATTVEKSGMDIPLPYDDGKAPVETPSESIPHYTSEPSPQPQPSPAPQPQPQPDTQPDVPAAKPGALKDGHYAMDANEAGTSMSVTLENGVKYTYTIASKVEGASYQLVVADGSVKVQKGTASEASKDAGKTDGGKTDAPQGFAPTPDVVAPDSGKDKTEVGGGDNNVDGNVDGGTDTKPENDKNPPAEENGGQGGGQENQQNDNSGGGGGQGGGNNQSEPTPQPEPTITWTDVTTGTLSSVWNGKTQSYADLTTANASTNSLKIDDTQTFLQSGESPWSGPLDLSTTTGVGAHVSVAFKAAADDITGTSMDDIFTITAMQESSRSGDSTHTITGGEGQDEVILKADAGTNLTLESVEKLDISTGGVLSAATLAAVAVPKAAITLSDTGKLALTAATTTDFSALVNNSSSEKALDVTLANTLVLQKQVTAKEGAKTNTTVNALKFSDGTGKDAISFSSTITLAPTKVDAPAEKVETPTLSTDKYNLALTNFDDVGDSLSIKFNTAAVGTFPANVTKDGTPAITVTDGVVSGVSDLDAFLKAADVASDGGVANGVYLLKDGDNWDLINLGTLGDSKASVVVLSGVANDLKLSVDTDSNTATISVAEAAI